MRLVRYRDKEEHYGALIKDRIVSLSSLAKLLSEKLPERLRNFITLGTKGVEKAEKLIKKANENDIRNASLKVNEITPLAPIAFPLKLFV